MENELSEELIILYKNLKPSVDLDTSLNVISVIENATDLNAFMWCLTNLHNFHTDECRSFSINNIYQFIFSSWPQIPEEIYPLIMEELFTKLFADPNYRSKEFHPLIFKSQSLAIYGLYPQHWPNFFNFLIELPKPLFYGFLRAFNDSKSEKATIWIRDIDGFFNNCYVDGSQMKIFQVVLNDTMSSIEGASECLSSIVEWANLSLLLNQNLIGIFLQLLAHPQTYEIGLSVFISIFHRRIAQDVLYELITQMNLVDLIRNITVKSEYNERIVKLCSNLLFSSLGKIVPAPPTLTELISNAAQLSMNLFMFPNKESTNFNYRLLLKIFGCYPMLSSQYFQMIITKISSSISLNSYDADIITQTSLRLFFVIARNSEIEVIPPLISLANGLNPNDNIVETATLLAALKTIIDSDNDEYFNLILSIGAMFSPLLGIQPPYSAPHFISLSNYLQIIQPLIDKIDPNIIAQIFMKCIELVMSEECIVTVSSDRKILLDCILNVCEKIPGIISTIPNVLENLPSLIQTGEINLIKSASLIVSILGENERMQFYTDSLKFFAYFLDLSIADPEAKYPVFYRDSAIKSTLEFWNLANTQNLVQLKPMIIPFFEAFYREKYDDFKNEELFSDFVQSSVNALGTDAFHIFWNTNSNLEQFNNAAVIMKSSLFLAQNPPYDERIKSVFDYMNKVFKLNNHSDRQMRKYDEVLQMREFYKYSTEFLILFIPNLNGNQADLGISISHLIEMLVSFCLPKKIMNKVVSFFLISPPLFVPHLPRIFDTFMKVLCEFKIFGNEEQKVLLLNLLKLLRILTSLSQSVSWESPLWTKIPKFDENGPEVMNNLMTCPNENFEEFANRFLFNVAPKQENYDDENLADTEDESME